MSDEDYMLYQQAVTIANTGQRHPAYEHFCLIRSHGNEDIALLFWIVATTPYPAEAQSVLGEIAIREPNHPSLHNARIDHERKLRQAQIAGLQPMGPVIRCPVCQTDAPILIKRKISTAGWVVFAILAVFMVTIVFCWIGLLIQEEYRVCSHCGARLG